VRALSTHQAVQGELQQDSGVDSALADEVVDDTQVAVSERQNTVLDSVEPNRGARGPLAPRGVTKTSQASFVVLQCSESDVSQQRHRRQFVA